MKNQYDEHEKRFNMKTMTQQQTGCLLLMMTQHSSASEEPEVEQKWWIHVPVREAHGELPCVDAVEFDLYFILTFIALLLINGCLLLPLPPPALI